MKQIAELNNKLSMHNMGQVYEMEDFEYYMENIPQTEIDEMTKDNFDFSHEFWEYDGLGGVRSFADVAEVLKVYNEI